MLPQMTLFHSFYGWVVFPCMHRPHLLYPLICQCIFRLLLCLGYCKQWCTKHSCLNFHCPLPLNSLLWFKIQLKCCFLYDFSLFLSIIIVFFFWIPSGVCLIYFLFFYSLNLQHDLYPVWWVFSCSLLCFLLSFLPFCSLILTSLQIHAVNLPWARHFSVDAKIHDH